MTVVAASALVWNDHLGKQHHPGVITGKVSDVAGLVVFPFLFAVLLVPLARPVGLVRIGRVAIAVTAVGFTAVQLVPAAAAGAAWILTAVAGRSMMVADATDLLALPVLVVPWRMWHRGCRRERGEQDRWTGQRTIAAAMLPLLAVATAATSCVEDDAVRALAWDGRVLYANVGMAGWASSRDGGQTWSEAEHDPAAGPPPGAVRPAGHPPLVECAPETPARCYRVADEQPRVEVSDDAGRTWSVAWEIPPARRQFVGRAKEGRALCEGTLEIGAQDLVVASHGEGHRVVVALAHQGVVVSHGEGLWYPVGIGDARPAPIRAPFRLIGMEMSAVGLLAVMIATRRLRRYAARQLPEGYARIRRGPARYLLWLAVLIGIATLWPGLALPWRPWIITGLVTLAFAALPTWVILARHASDRADAAAIRRAFVAGVVIFVAGSAPFVAWSAGTLPRYGVAVLIAVAAGTAAATKAMTST